jgi:hypothetical protein
MEEIISAFRQTIYGAHKSRKFICCHRDALRFVEHYPTSSPIVGLIPCPPNGFLHNSSVYSAFCGLKRNSCNRNFQQHGFVLDGTCNVQDELNNRFPGLNLSPRNWVKRVFVFGPFNGQTSEAEADCALNHARAVRARRVPAAPPRPAAEPAEMSDEPSDIAEISEDWPPSDFQWSW